MRHSNLVSGGRMELVSNTNIHQKRKNEPMKTLADISVFESLQNSGTRSVVENAFTSLDRREYSGRAKQAQKEIQVIGERFTDLYNRFQQLNPKATPEDRQKIKREMVNEFKGLDGDFGKLKQGWLGSYIFDNAQCKEAYDKVKKIRFGFINRFNKTFYTKEKIGKGYWDNTKIIPVDARYAKADTALIRAKFPALESVLDIVKANNAFNGWYRKAKGFVDAVSDAGVNSVSKPCQELYNKLIKYKLFKEPMKPNTVTQWARHSGWYKRLQSEVPALRKMGASSSTEDPSTKTANQTPDFWTGRTPGTQNVDSAKPRPRRLSSEQMGQVYGGGNKNSNPQ